jgi:hypothetical protein
MKKVFVLLTLAAVMSVLALKSTVYAIPPFEKQFLEKYYDPKSKDPNVKKLADAIEKIQKQNMGKTESCNICHIEGKSKKERNSYGNDLKKEITKKDKEDIAKIKKGLETTGKVKSPAGPTWDDILKKGALPIEGEKDGAPKTDAKK